MNKHILNDDQIALLPFIQKYNNSFYLVGGTAIALHLGHRRSIDFDLFCKDTFDPLKIRNSISKSFPIEHVFSQGEGELTVLINRVKVTYFHYPFPIIHTENALEIIEMPSILTLGAMKAYALGRRAKWKDYVDLYYIFQHISFVEVLAETKAIFKNEFNEKLFRTQLGYFKDIDHSEKINFMPGFEKSDEEIQTYLKKISIQ